MYNALLLSFLAGISTLLGLLSIYIKINNINKFISFILLITSIIMIYISCFDLLPQAIKLLDINLNKYYVILICYLILLGGILFVYIIDKLLIYKDNLYRVGIITMISIIIHNIPEGIITFISSYNNIRLGITLTIAIALHNIPEGISIAIPIYHATKNKIKTFFYVFLAACAEPLGSLIAILFIDKYNSNNIISILCAFVSGIMLKISLLDLIPNAYKYIKK